MINSKLINDRIETITEGTAGELANELIDIVFSVMDKCTSDNNWNECVEKEKYLTSEEKEKVCHFFNTCMDLHSVLKNKEGYNE